MSEGQDAVFTLTRRGVPGPCHRVRVRVSGHERVMGRLTAQLDEFDVVFPPGATTRTLRLPTQQDNRNEGDGEVRVTILRSAGHPRSAAVRVRDDDVPEVALHAAFTPCNREHEFPVRQDQSYTGPTGGEIRL